MPVFAIAALCVTLNCEPHAKTPIRIVQNRKLGLSEAITIGEALKRFPYFEKVTWETRFPTGNATTVIMRGRLTDEACTDIRNRLRQRLDLISGDASVPREERDTRKRLVEAYLSLKRIYLTIEFNVIQRENGDTVRIQAITYEGDTDNGEIQGIYTPEGELARLYEQRQLSGPKVW